VTLREASLVAFDGTHASGKTTLIYAVAALLRAKGVHVGVLPEPARASPFVDDVVIHKVGDFDMLLELDLFAAQIRNCVRAARGHDVILADKTPTNVLAYCKMVLRIEPATWDAAMVDAMGAFCRSWGTAYDAVFYCQDHFGIQQQGDRYRSKVAHLQGQADLLVREEYTALDQELIPIPSGLAPEERAQWVIQRMRQLAIPTEA
jgi:predicted ATPase